MSCKECEIEQEKGFGTYVRVGSGNVYVSGCEYHLNMMFEELKKGRAYHGGITLETIRKAAEFNGIRD